MTLTLIRLRIGAPLADLANRFQAHQSTVSRIFNTMVEGYIGLFLPSYMGN